jgi:hypothetical protein
MHQVKPYTSSYHQEPLRSLIPALSSVDYLVVAGGGGGGGSSPAAVAVLVVLELELDFPVSATPGSYTVTVGAGGIEVGGNSANSMEIHQYFQL